MPDVPVSEQKVLECVNRKLGLTAQVRKAESKEQADELGAYFVVDLDSNTLSERDIGLEPYARSIGCLSDCEIMEG